MELPKFKDAEFMTAKEKAMVLKQWETFLKHGCQEKHFTDRLYKHLTLHCEFIAHYSRAGFYATYFERGEDTAHFLKQFDLRQADPIVGIPASIEYGMTYWVTGDYTDINMAMIQVASQYIPQLTKTAEAKQRDADIAQASALLTKHGISFGITLKETRNSVVGD